MRTGIVAVGFLLRAQEKDRDDILELLTLMMALLEFSEAS